MDAFPSHVMFVLAGLKLLSGLILALFGSLAVLARAAGHELFVGVWAGTATLVSAILALAVAKNRDVYSLSFTTMNGVALVTSVSAAVLAANALVVDAGHFGQLDFATGAVAISIRQKERIMVIDFVLTIFSALDTLLSAVCVLLGLRQISLNNKGSILGSESVLTSKTEMKMSEIRGRGSVAHSPLMLSPMWPRLAFEQRYPTAKMATRSNSMCSRGQVALVPLVYYWPNNGAYSFPQYNVLNPQLVSVHGGSSRILANSHCKFAKISKNNGRLRRNFSLCDRDLEEQFVDHTLNEKGSKMNYRMSDRRSNSRVNCYYDYFGNNKSANCNMNEDNNSHMGRQRNGSNTEGAAW